MGERLLLGLRDFMIDYPIWLYHHWLGTEINFMTMIAEVYVENKLYKRPSSNATDWLRGLLNYRGSVLSTGYGFQLANVEYDKNYFAAILTDMADIYILWAPLYRKNLKIDMPRDMLWKQMTDIMKEDIYHESLDLRMYIYNPLKEYIKDHFNRYIILEMKHDDTSKMLRVINDLIVKIQAESEEFENNYRNIKNHPFVQSVLGTYNEIINKLSQLAATLMSESLD